MLIVKIMSTQELCDDDTAKAHELIAGVRRVTFPETAAEAMMLEIDGLSELEPRYPGGNVYVMNEAGRTISTFTAPPPAEPYPIPIPPELFRDIDHPVLYCDGNRFDLLDIARPLSVIFLRELFQVPAHVGLVRDGVHLGTRALITVSDGDEFYTLDPPSA